jgi:hypothetical protein
MSQLGDMGRHAGGLYRKALRQGERPVQKVEAEVHHLHEIERAGESGLTQFIAFGGLILFLLPIFLVMLGLALVAYYIF